MNGGELRIWKTSPPVAPVFRWRTPCRAAHRFRCVTVTGSSTGRFAIASIKASATSWESNLTRAADGRASNSGHAIYSISSNSLNQRHAARVPMRRTVTDRCGSSRFNSIQAKPNRLSEVKSIDEAPWPALSSAQHPSSAIAWKTASNHFPRAACMRPLPRRDGLLRSKAMQPLCSITWMPLFVLA